MTEAEKFVVSQAQPSLAPDEEVEHIGYLIGYLDSEGFGLFAQAARAQACFIALTAERAFFLWSKPGRIGAFRPLLEYHELQILDRATITARVERVRLVRKCLTLSLPSGERARFELQRKVRALPGQAQCIEALLASAP